MHVADRHCVVCAARQQTGSTVFKITKSGNETVLYSFNGGSDGASPDGILLDVKGVLFGTTFSGGGASSAGTIYKIKP